MNTNKTWIDLPDRVIIMDTHPTDVSRATDAVADEQLGEAGLRAWAKGLYPLEAVTTRSRLARPRRRPTGRLALEGTCVLRDSQMPA